MGVGKGAALIILGAAFVFAWVIIGIAFLHRLTGWQLSALGILGPAGILSISAGIAVASRRTRA